MSDVLERFLRYVRIDTTSREERSDRVPSTEEQVELARLLGEELRALGARDVLVDDHAYVTAHLPASPGAEARPGLGLIAHLDTTEDAPGHGVDPRVITYEGGDLETGAARITPQQLPALNDLVGHELVVSAGDTLLGADDKAGIAEIMALVARLAAHPELPHPSIAVCFAPDEEIGHGARMLDLEQFGCAYAYTVDGGPIGELEWECFNAAAVTMRFQGHTTHPGDAKNVMVNAVHLFEEYQGMLPAAERPEHTEGYEGFIHTASVSGTCEHVTARYIVRDHDAEKFARKLEVMRAATSMICLKHGAHAAEIEVEEQYRNMADAVRPFPELVDHARAAYRDCGYEPRVIPVRGGTDGAQLSLRGLPCPNLSTGGFFCHSVNEFVPVSSLEGMVDVLQALVARFA